MRKTVKTKTIAAPKPSQQFDPSKKQVLHIMHHPERESGLARQFANPMWQEIRTAKQKTSGIASNQFHGVWLPSGVLEHCYFHEVPTMLAEIYRLLRVEGVLLMAAFDIQKVAEYVAKGNLEGRLYKTPGGTDITPLDVLYGYRPELQAGNVTANPNTAFTARTLAAKLQTAGFAKIQVKREGMLLWALAHKLVRAEGAPAQVEIIEEDVNKMMRARDELNKAPEIWTAPSPLFG
jgi:hypothetical protein